MRTGPTAAGAYTERLNERRLALHRRCRELEAALAEALDIGEDGWSYAGDYFLEKYDVGATFRRLRAVLDPPPV